MPTKSDLESQMEKIQRSTKTLFPFFSSIHDKLRLRFKSYNKWHQTEIYESVHVSTLAFVLVLIVSTIVYIARVPEIYASTNTKVWTSQADFESGSNSNIDTTTNPGETSLAQSTDSYTEDFSTSTYFDSGASTADWDTATQKLKLSGDISPTMTDLENGLKSVVNNPNTTINAIERDPVNGFIYIATNASEFLMYNPTDNSVIDLSSKIENYWTGGAIVDLEYDTTNNFLYLAGQFYSDAGYSKFGAFNGGADPANGSFIQISGFGWPTNDELETLTFDSTNGYVYLAGQDKSFKAFLGGADPANGTFVNLGAKLADFASSGDVDTIAFDSTNNYVYLGNDRGQFGAFLGGADPANGTYVSLISKISTDWSSAGFYSLAFDATNGYIYMGGDYKFGAFLGGVDPANGTWVYLWAKVSTEFFSPVFSLSYDLTNEYVYLGGQSDKFGAFIGGSDPANGTWTNLSSKVAADIDGIIYSTIFDSSNNQIYLGGSTSDFGKYSGGSNPANGTWTNLSTYTDNLLSNYFNIQTMTHDPTNGYIYIGGTATGNNFMAYNISSGSFINLNSKIVGDWANQSVKTLSFDSTNGVVYLGGQSGKFGAFIGGSDPANGTYTHLVSKISVDWSTGYIYDIGYDSTNGIMYLSGPGGKFGAFIGGSDPANGTWTYLSSKISADWSTSTIESSVIDVGNGYIYIGSANKFGAYSLVSDPSTGVWSNLISKITTDFNNASSGHMFTMSFDATNNIVYIGGGSTSYGGSKKFGAYVTGANPSSGSYLSLTSKMSWGLDNYRTISSSAFAFGKAYLGTQSGEIASFDGGADPANGSWTNLRSEISGFIVAETDIEELMYAESLSSLFIGGVGAEFAVYESGYQANNVAYTSTVDSAANNISSATATFTSSAPANTTLTFELSANGGVNYESVTSGVLHNFTNAGSDLRIKFNLTTTDSSVTPEVTAISLSYSSYTSLTGSINFTYDATTEVNFYQLSHTASTPTNTTLTYKARTATTEAGLVSATWTSAFTTLPHSLTSETTDARWVEIQSDFATTDGISSPSIFDLTLQYVDNGTPELQNISISYATDGTKTLTIGYEVKDPDTSSNPANPNQVNITFTYSTDNGNNFSSFTGAAITGDSGLVTAAEGSFTAYQATIDTSIDIDETYSTQFVIKITANDNELARNSTSTNSSSITFDSKAPTSPSFSIAGGATTPNTVNLTSIIATDDSTLSLMIVSTASDFTGASYQAYATTLPNFPATGSDIIYLKIKDQYGNVSTSTSSLVPITIQNVIISDLSNASSSNYRLAIGWDATEDVNVDSYDIYRKVGSGNYSILTNISDTTINLYGDTTVSAGTAYSYKIYAKDVEGDLGVSSSVVSATPAFTPTISAITVVATSYDRVTITWTTDANTDSFIEFGTDTSYGATQGSTDLTTSHSLIITGLNSGTTFHFRARSRDQAGTLGLSSDGTFETTTEPASIIDESSKVPSINSVQVSDQTFDSAIIIWESTVVTKSELQYGSSKGIYTNTVLDESPNNFTTLHTIKIDSLSQGANYHFRVIGTDLLGNKYASDNYTFSTLAMPVATNVKIGSVASQSAVITWDTNVDTNSYVTYAISGSERLDMVQGIDTDSTTNHTVTLKNLSPSTTYVFKTKSTDSYGNASYSEPSGFTTTIDVAPPVISDLRSETALISDETGESRVQAIISWTTDEPATSQIQYNESVKSQNSYSQSTPEDQSYTNSHVVIIQNLKPSTTYHMIAVSKDTSENITTSRDYTVITKRQEKSLLQIIIQTLEESFSWIKNIGVFGN